MPTVDCVPRRAGSTAARSVGTRVTSPFAVRFLS